MDQGERRETKVAPWAGLVALTQLFGLSGQLSDLAASDRIPMDTKEEALRALAALGQVRLPNGALEEPNGQALSVQEELLIISNRLAVLVDDIAPLLREPVALEDVWRPFWEA
jgi:hypothetical protein